ncbi:hypothetical protein CcrSwift_gp152 [Caulobacter phage CcrSwift]|uniref:Uncharacterized protein n=1 Tax=Caulobacter phage CcrSwift TaxID=2927984 RepID=K4JVP2_9CAUD|nr:hypothetical protein D870_gp269 [Caulobacter phage CcrSwift]AFU88470.1 hypothetical protein CcrSwift_gp152 [Caulobacter phage CcrSwift]
MTAAITCRPLDQRQGSVLPSRDAGQALEALQGRTPRRSPGSPGFGSAKFDKIEKGPPRWGGPFDFKR